MRRPATEPQSELSGSPSPWVHIEVLSEREAARRVAVDRPARARASVRNEVRDAIIRTSPFFKRHHDRFVRLVRQARNAQLYAVMAAAGEKARAAAAPVRFARTIDELGRLEVFGPDDSQ